jgi:predicted nucleic acid-binding protein
MPSRSRRSPRAAEPSAVYLAQRPVMVDSNVLIDVIDNDPRWAEWSLGQLEAAMLDAGLVINPIIYAELAAGFADVETLEAAIAPFALLREPLPWEAAFMASQACKRYRRQGGTKRSPMPDFYIGAHASLAGYRLLTRDARRYREHFSKLEVIAPT